MSLILLNYILCVGLTRVDHGMNKHIVIYIILFDSDVLIELLLF